MTKITGRLENWTIQKYPQGEIYWGNIYGDIKGRFADGDYIHTSLITKRDEQIIHTLNSTYELGKPSGIWPDA